MKLLWTIGGSLFLAACGGGGGSSDAGNASGTTASGDTGGSGVAQNPPVTTPSGAQSPGGIWHSFGGPTSAVTLYIAEDGNLRVQDQGPAFGTGAVIVTSGNSVSGSYQSRSIQSSPTAPPSQSLTCEVTGTVTQRVALQLALHCTDASGAVTDRSYVFGYDPAYDVDSSLAAIAGNYTLSINTQTNTLTIAGDGALFGMFHNGAQCLVNGRVEIPDPNFNLYELEMTFSNCQFLKSHEGQTMTGFAARGLPGLPSGAFLLLVTGMINGRLEFHSLLYERT
jgi:hypothetical protein